jgi:hypothetical protein
MKSTRAAAASTHAVSPALSSAARTMSYLRLVKTAGADVNGSVAKRARRTR